jgi:uncharacterized surface protein with fasciclin (FAS1) repeats
MSKRWKGIIKGASVLAVTGLVLVTGCEMLGKKKQGNGKSSTAPKTSENIIQVAKGAGTFNTLTKALQTAGLTNTLETGGPFTVFAPTDAAFAQLPPGELDNLMKPDSKQKLQAILRYHVVEGRISTDELKKEQTVMTLEGEALTVKVQNGKIYVDDAMVEGADIAASNGVIHVINKVLMPPTMETVGKSSKKSNGTKSSSIKTGSTMNGSTDKSSNY